MHERIHTYYVYTYMHEHIHAFVHTHMHTYVHTCMLTLGHTSCSPGYIPYIHKILHIHDTMHTSTPKLSLIISIITCPDRSQYTYCHSHHSGGPRNSFFNVWSARLLLENRWKTWNRPLILTRMAVHTNTNLLQSDLPKNQNILTHINTHAQTHKHRGTHTHDTYTHTHTHT